MARGKLTDDVRTFIVQALACFDTPAVVAAAVRKEFRVEIAPQSVEGYDPNKRAGRNLAKRWREIFKATREEFLKDTSKIAISHRAVRLRALQRMAEKAETIGNMALAAQLHEQAAKECGDAFTNKRQLSGPNGGPVQVVASTMTAKEAADAYASTLNGD